EVASGALAGSERDAREDRAVLEREERRPGVADARIDDRARARQGAREHAEMGGTDGSTGGLERRCGPALEAPRATATIDGRASFPASRDRYAGLSGPAAKEPPKGSMAALAGLRRERATGSGSARSSGRPMGSAWRWASASTLASGPVSSAD